MSFRKLFEKPRRLKSFQPFKDEEMKTSQEIEDEKITKEHNQKLSDRLDNLSFAEALEEAAREGVKEKAGKRKNETF